LAALVAALLLSGCGGTDKGALSRCINEYRNAAEAAAVARLYEQGKLGTRAQIERELDRSDVTFFDDDGHMLPYLDMTVKARSVFDYWKGRPRVFALTNDARQQALARIDRTGSDRKACA